jgi:hypothetical protein
VSARIATTVDITGGLKTVARQRLSTTNENHPKHLPQKPVLQI